MKYLWLVSLFYCFIHTQSLGQTSLNDSQNCNKAKAELREVQGINGSGQFEISTSNMTFPLKYVFYDNDNKELSQQPTLELVNGLVEGSYYCIVVDAKGCRIRVESHNSLKQGLNE